MTYLLDVNLLLALSDPMHIHHESAHRWFSEKGQQSWATCPLTENALLRIVGGFDTGVDASLVPGGPAALFIVPPASGS